MNQTKIWFFIIFYLILGSTGVTLPLAFNGFIINDVAIGLVTIVISTVGYASIERNLYLHDNNAKKLELVINYGVIVLFFLATIFVSILISQKHDILPLSIAVLAYIGSCSLWWYQNRNNDNFSDNQSALGGNSNQFKS